MGTPSTSRQGSRVLLQTASSSSITITEPQDETDRRVEPPVLKLRLHKPKNDKKVKWTAGTVDNEGMDKKKSKCCCIYVKPREFGESSSESEDECEHCYGHVEHKHKKKPPGKDPPSPDDKPANDDGPK